MKFGHAFQEHLQQDGFPPHWVASAISYRQLKKCIKKLLRTAEQERDEKLAEYLLSNPQSTPRDPDAPVLFQPKLLIAVDEETGEPLDAHLSPLSRDYLQRQALAQQLSDVRIGNLQANEQKKLSRDVTALGMAVTKVTEPNCGSAAKTDMARWRKIFELYLESKIFFSTNELDHGKHDSAKAQVLLQKFSDELQRQGLVSAFRKKESIAALDRFLRLNTDVLQSLRFQEINDLAMQKILKKFDKRTALGVKTTFPAVIRQRMPQDIAKAICYQVSTELLPVVPQLDDYLCPVCFSISYRPIRLRCQHIFCIRCLIVLQRAREDHCPLCRGDVVMEADNQNLDPALAKFLVKYFPDEVKAKQKENERAAGVDRYGEAYNDKCTVM
ncbi:putative RING finger protein [Botryosphaeria dothidea]|uniref:RING finger protein n=1 Tax=Botryosphaeria dothidea TaxID=55169 RepID=A0A8H4N328_9PEZI|nr:putative RING finger protein [Botryosphaeria dothidea]